MSSITILLKAFNTEGYSQWVPAEVVQTYQELETLSFNAFSKNQHFWNVHFHFQDLQCEGNVLPLFWSSGNYFDSESGLLRDGKMSVFAHFEKKGGPTQANVVAQRESHNRTFDRPNGSNSGTIPTHTAPFKLTPSSPDIKRERKDLVLISSDAEEAKPNLYSPNSKRKTRPSPSERASTPVSDPPDSDFTPSAPRPPRKRRKTKHAAATAVAAAGHGPTPHPSLEAPAATAIAALPSNLSRTTWERDFKAALENNASPGSPYHKFNWDKLSLATRNRYAHARLMHGDYGINNPKPCVRCTSNAETCRIYHPSLHGALPLTLPNMCEKCRLTGRTCE